MNSFKIWILSLCGATAITALFKILLSKSSLNKILNIFFTLFVLFYTIMPLQSLFNIKEFNNFSFNTSYENDEIYKKGYEQIIELSIKKECEKLDVKVISFNIVSNLNNDNTLSVEKIEIQINNEGKNEMIKNAIKEQLGYEVTVK